MEKLKNIFFRNNFKLTNETSKALEFENIKSKDVVYLMQSKEISIVMHPDTAESFKLKDDHNVKYHNTALKRFPKRMNGGQDPIHYGYSFKLNSEDEADAFLNKLNRFCEAR